VHLGDSFAACVHIPLLINVSFRKNRANLLEIFVANFSQKKLMYFNNLIVIFISATNETFLEILVRSTVGMHCNNLCGGVKNVLMNSK
jgi:hypothetical protein